MITMVLVCAILISILVLHSKFRVSGLQGFRVSGFRALLLLVLGLWISGKAFRV